MNDTPLDIANALRSEYLKQDFNIKNIRFYAKKIPAMKAALLFVEIASRFSNVGFDLSNPSKVISAFDPDYLQNKLMPIIFDTMKFDLEKASEKGMLLNQNLDIIDERLSWDDVLELVFRGLCINFLDSLAGRLSRLQEINKILSN